MTRRMFTCVSLVGLVALASGCASHTHRLSDIDPRAHKALKEMSNTIAHSHSFEFHCESTMDAPTASGQLAQHTRSGNILVHRPNRICASSRAGQDDWAFWYDGHSLTILNKTALTYATVSHLPHHIDKMLDEVAKIHSITFPLADFLFSDPYKVLTADAHTGRYVGESNVGGVKCHHLLFTQENIDWQIWIDTNSPHVPRKFVIDYKTVRGRPQFSALFSNWNLSAHTREDQFKSVLPPDAKRVEMAQLMRGVE